SQRARAREPDGEISWGHLGDELRAEVRDEAVGHRGAVEVAADTPQRAVGIDPRAVKVSSGRVLANQLPAARGAVRDRAGLADGVDVAAAAREPTPRDRALRVDDRGPSGPI